MLQAYDMLWTRDFEYTMEYMLPLMDGAALAASHQQVRGVRVVRRVVRGEGGARGGWYEGRVVRGYECYDSIGVAREYEGSHDGGMRGTTRC